MAKLLGQPFEQLRCHQANLGGPRVRVSRYDELALAERLGLGVRGQLWADDPGPAAEDRADGGLLAPAARGQQAAHGGVEWLGVAVTPGGWPPQGPPKGGGGGGGGVLA
jgi:hypothetical protein